MTEQAYLDDPTVREFEATVERVLDGESPRVVLDRTHFYPEGGGQPNDTGILRTDDADYRVVDVQKRDTIHHAVEGSAPTAGTTVTGELDWGRRYAHMRYHTAQHLLSALLLAEYDAPTTGNQLYDDHAHLDCTYDRFTETDLSAVETRLNDLIEEARPVRWYELDRERAESELDPERTRLALLPESITDVRIVEIGGPDGEVYDRTACAGTHVSTTEGIGPVAVTGRETKGSDEERIRFELVEG